MIVSRRFKELRGEWVTNREIEHHIPTVPGALPEYHRHSYNVRNEQLGEHKKQWRGFAAKGFFVPSTAPRAAPVFFRPKSNGSLRLAIDHRNLNHITIRDVPKIHDLINTLGKAQCFSMLHLQSGYHHLRVAREDFSH